MPQPRHSLATALNRVQRQLTGSCCCTEHLKEKQRTGWAKTQDSTVTTSPWQTALRASPEDSDAKSAEPGSKLQEAVSRADSSSGAESDSADDASVGEGELLGVVCVTADHRVRSSALQSHNGTLEKLQHLVPAEYGGFCEFFDSVALLGNCGHKVHACIPFVR